MKKIIDLTHTISESMPVYPGTEPPKLALANTYEKDGFKETLLSMFSHTGTHMDAPSHLFPERTTLDQLPISQFIGPALVIDCTDLQEGARITIERIQAVQDLADQADFLLFYMGWDTRWGTDSFFDNYPYLTEDVAQYVIDSGKKGVGLDVIGIDPISDTNLSIHRKLFEENDIVVIENLSNLSQIGNELFTFCALPLKYEGADGSPIRAVAIIE